MARVRVSTAERVRRAIAKAAAEGRTITHQQARGHRAHEHRTRAVNKAAKAGLPPPSFSPRSGPRPGSPRPGSPRPGSHGVSHASLIGALTPSHRKAVRRFARDQADRAARTANPGDHVIDPATLADNAVSWATRVGYGEFERLRAVTRARQRQYRTEKRAGEPSMAGILDVWSDEYDGADHELFYYH